MTGRADSSGIVESAALSHWGMVLCCQLVVVSCGQLNHITNADDLLGTPSS